MGCDFNMKLLLHYNKRYPLTLRLLSIGGNNGILAEELENVDGKWDKREIRGGFLLLWTRGNLLRFEGKRQ